MQMFAKIKSHVLRSIQVGGAVTFSNSRYSTTIMRLRPKLSVLKNKAILNSNDIDHAIDSLFTSSIAYFYTIRFVASVVSCV
jgi:hypothetical protein